MSIKEYIKIQSKECKNKILKEIFLDLYDVFFYENKKANKNYYTIETFYAKDKCAPKVVADNIKNKKIYILPDYNKEDKSVTTKNMQTGYKSTISEDIVADNGDIYDFYAEYQSYKFYKFKDEYYIRLNNSNVVSKINEYNYNRFKSILE